MGTKVPVTAFATCTLVDEAGPASNTDSAATGPNPFQSVTVPPYWIADNLIGQTGCAESWYVPVSPTGAPGCSESAYAAPTYKKVDTAALSTSGPGGGRIGIGGSGGSATGKTTNVDHVYEVAILKRFFESKFSSRPTATANSDDECRDFRTVFNVFSLDSRYAGRSRLQSVYDQLPGAGFGGLAGMESKLNDMKGKLFGTLPKFVGRVDHTSVDNSLSNLIYAGIAMDVMHDAEIKELFVAANTRIYEAFLGIDEAIKSGCYPSSADPQVPIIPTWAGAYQQWMMDYMSQQETANQAWASGVMHRLSSVIYPTPSSSWYTSYATHAPLFDTFERSPYAQPNHWKFSMHLDWPTNSPLQMRDNLRGRDSVCSISSSTTSSKPVEPTCGPIPLWSVPDFTSVISPGPPNEENFDFVYEKAQYPNLFQIGFQWTYTVTPGILARFNMTFLGADGVISTAPSFNNNSCLSFVIPQDSTISMAV